VAPELERVQELKRPRRVDVGVLPLEPHVHVDVVRVRLQVELLDVVDEHPDAHDAGTLVLLSGGAVGRGRQGDRGERRRDEQASHLSRFKHGRRSPPRIGIGA
jgi:hypothetical protein